MFWVCECLCLWVMLGELVWVGLGTFILIWVGVIIHIGLGKGYHSYKCGLGCNRNVSCIGVSTLGRKVLRLCGEMYV